MYKHHMLDQFPHTWRWRSDTQMRPQYFQRQRSSIGGRGGARGTAGGSSGASSAREVFSNMPNVILDHLGASDGADRRRTVPPHQESEHATEANVLVAKTEDGIEVVHFYTYVSVLRERTPMIYASLTRNTLAAAAHCARSSCRTVEECTPTSITTACSITCKQVCYAPECAWATFCLPCTFREQSESLETTPKAGVWPSVLQESLPSRSCSESMFASESLQARSIFEYERSFSLSLSLSLASHLVHLHW